jgi:Fe-S cluster assembly protein SufD
MSAPANVRNEYLRQFRALEPQLPGTGRPWLKRLRERALESFAELGFPTGRDEDWKYTDVSALAGQALTPAGGGVRPGAAAIAPSRFDAHELVFVDGHFAPELSSPGTAEEGVEVMSLSAALGKDLLPLEHWLGGSDATGRHGFAALNLAFLREGAFVHIRRNVAPERPVHLLFVSTGAPHSVAYLRNLVVAEAGAEATIIESYAGSGAGACLTNAVTEVVAEAGARLEHYRLTAEGEAGWHIGGTYVRQARDSRYASHAVALRGRTVRHEIHAALNAEGAECTLNGLYVLRGRQHVDNHTRIDHFRPRGTSREWYKGVLDDASRGVFSGRVVVHPGAQHTDAAQNNRNLLLSPNAEADSRPQLEIYADDVKCAHGSSEGSLDPDQLFYLRARGLDQALARRLLVYAFAADVLARMKHGPVRTRLETQLIGRLLPGQSVTEWPG